MGKEHDKTDEYTQGMQEDEIDALFKKAADVYGNAARGDGAADADTILAGIMENQEFDYEVFDDIIGIYRDSGDKKSIRAMFFEFTGVEFEDYLRRCIEETAPAPAKAGV